MKRVGAQYSAMLESLHYITFFGGGCALEQFDPLCKFFFAVPGGEGHLADFGIVLSIVVGWEDFLQDSGMEVVVVR